MDCLTQTKSCESQGLCTLKCCESLVCVGDKNDHLFPELVHAYNEQCNYYRALIAQQCPLDSCKTRAQFFSEASVDSPIYDTRCDSLHLTTILTDSCNRVIQEYCTANLGNPGFVDAEVCTSFVSTQSLFTTHDWNTECEGAYNATVANQYPLVSNVCYAAIRQECLETNACPCFNKRYVNDTSVQLIECLFNTCVVETTTNALPISVCVLVLLTYLFYEYNIYYQKRYSLCYTLFLNINILNDICDNTIF